MTKKGTIPILHNIEFLDRMDALVRGFSLLTQEDIEKFWREFKYQVYESYRDASYWRDFKSVIELIVESEE